MSASSSKVPRFLRNPWFLAAIGGMISFVTLIRPLTRRVPDPPPVTGQATPFKLAQADQGRFGSDQLRDHVYLATFLPGSCGDTACAARLEALVGLQRRCLRFGVKLWLVSVAADGAGPEAARQLEALIRGRGGQDQPPGHRWLALAAESDAERARLEADFRPHADRAAAARRRTGPAQGSPKRPAPAAGLAGWGVLVDGDGGVRGAYPLDPDGLYEVFHRAQRVMALRRSWR